MTVDDAEQHFTNILAGLEKEHGVVVIALEIEEIEIRPIASRYQEIAKRVRIHTLPPPGSRWDTAR